MADRTDLNRECRGLELIIDNLEKGKESCRFDDSSHSLEVIIDYLRGYLQELKELNRQIMVQGNAPELLQSVYDKYSELWCFQIDHYIDSLPSVIDGLWRYPKND